MTERNRNPEVEKRARDKYEEKNPRVQVVNAIKAPVKQAPTIKRQIAKIAKRHNGEKATAILAAIKHYSEQ